MKSTKLTKEYYFPEVKGSSWGVAVVRNRLLSFFVGYQIHNNYILKIENFHWLFNFVLGTPLVKRIGYTMYGEEYEAVVKGNKYLKKQYSRMAKYLANNEIEKYTALFNILKNRSEYFLIVFWVRKAKDYKIQVNTGKIFFILKDIRKALKNGSTRLDFKRVFLIENNPDGSFKKRRPLGVPEIKSRVRAAMYEFYLVNLLKSEWSENQFACMPKRGVVDAWIKILTIMNNKPNIVGIDLAKFFDTVFIKTVTYALNDSKVPKEIQEYLEKIHLNAPKLRPQDKKFEIERINSLKIEAPIMLYPPVEDLMTSVPEHNWNDRDKSLPQGLNTSPILSCHVLNLTGCLISRPEIGYDVVQYVDDALLFGGPSPYELTRHYTTLLNPYTTGINISEKKTEIIKENGVWLRPMKFLGCEYDGKDFKAHTRSKGVVTIYNAANRIEEIIKWLEINRGDIKSYERTKLSKLINEGWNNEEYLLGQPKAMLKGSIDEDRKSLWDKYRIKLTRIAKGSVEYEVIMKYKELGNSLIYSTNTMSMLCAGRLLNSSRTIDKIRARKAKVKIPLKEVSKATSMTKAVLYIAGYWIVILILFPYITNLLATS